jgi:hypothetical protein
MTIFMQIRGEVMSERQICEKINENEAENLQINKTLPIMKRGSEQATSSKLTHFGSSWLRV